MPPLFVFKGFLCWKEDYWFHYYTMIFFSTVQGLLLSSHHQLQI